MKLRSSLFRKYATVLMALVGALIVSTGAVEMAYLFQEIRETREVIQRSAVQGAAQRIEQYLSTIHDQIRDVGRLPWDMPSMGERERRDEYHRLLKLVPAIAELRSVDLDGRERLRVSRILPDAYDTGNDLSAEPAFQDALGKGLAYGSSHFRDGSDPYVTVGLREDTPRPRVILGELNLRFVGEVLAQIAAAKTGTVYVMDGEGHLIAHPDPRIVLRKIDLRTSSAIPALRRAVETAPDKLAGMIEGTGIGGGRMMLSGASIPSARWIVVFEEPYAEVFAPVWGALARIAAILGTGLVVALVSSYFLARRMAQPILELGRGAERIARGDLATLIEMRTGDEVELLAHQFNDMANQLQEYTDSLEEKVQEKTSELQVALRLAHDAMRARALFLAAASHDLRQPLYAISILADTLSSEPLPAAAATVLGKQRQAIDVLRTLFDNLLDLSRFDAGEIRPALRVAALREVLAPCVLEHEVICHAKGLRFHCEIEQAWVRSDPELVRRVVGNVLSNAVRYTAEGSVRLDAKVEGTHVRITVTDTGIGIAAADQKRIFEEFVQLANPARERDKGVGLGLSIVRRIAALLDMDIHLESEPARGTTIEFKVPMAVNERGDVAEEDLSFAAEGAFRGSRIWIVEDDPLVRDALSLQFNAWEALPAFATTASELLALREADGRWPDAVILDDMLGSGEQGLEISRMLREYVDEERIVLVTGNVDPVRTLDLEASGLVVLRKPLASTDLAQWLRRVLRSDVGATTAPAREPAE